VKLAILRPEPEPKAPSELLDVLAVSHEEEAGGKIPVREIRISSGIPGGMSLPNKTKSKNYTDIGV